MLDKARLSIRGTPNSDFLKFMTTAMQMKAAEGLNILRNKKNAANGTEEMR